MEAIPSFLANSALSVPQVQASSFLFSKQTRVHISSQLPVSLPCFPGNRVR